MVCSFRYVDCDCMVCVLFGVLSATVWCGTFRCVECDCVVCVIYGVLSKTVWYVYCSLC